MARARGDRRRNMMQRERLYYRREAEVINRNELDTKREAARARKRAQLWAELDADLARDRERAEAQRSRAWRRKQGFYLF